MPKTNVNDVAASFAGRLKPVEPRGLAGLMPNGIEGARRLPLELISPNPHQARQTFNEASLAELAASIEDRGVLQPIIVRRVDESYVIVGGERRWRATLMLHQRMPDDPSWQSIPAIVREYDSEAEAGIDTAIENLQREDLSVAEEAQMYEDLIAAWKLNPNRANRELARRTGVDRNRIDRVRLVGRFPGLADSVASGSMTMVEAETHARASTAQKNGHRADTDAVVEREDLNDGGSLPQLEANSSTEASPTADTATLQPAVVQAATWRPLFLASRNVSRLVERVRTTDIARLPQTERPTLLRTVDQAIKELQELKSKLEATATE